MNEEHFGLAQVLMTVFPGHPERHIAWIPGGEPGKKNITTRKRKAELTDFLQHLHPSSRDGEGAVGIIPGIRSGQVWRTPWAALDFDDDSPEKLHDYFRLLTAKGFTVLFNRGTRGRGTHIYLLLDTAVTLHQAHKALTFLAEVAKAMGAGHIDLRPSSPSIDSGSGLLLPYRGAGEDGEGANCLIDADTGEIVTLDKLPNYRRQSVATFTALIRLGSASAFMTGQTRSYRPPRLPPLKSVIAQSQDRWTAELERLTDHWYEGSRHYLMMGATAYGVHLGVDPARIRQDLLNLAEDNNDEDWRERGLTIKDGLDKAAQGIQLAFREYYEQAGVEPPRGGATARVREHVSALLAALMDRSWRGKGSKTDRSLLKLLLSLAWQHGYEHPEGIEISVAWSTLGEQGNIASSDTLSQSLSRLEHGGWLRRGLGSEAGKSGSFILLVEERSTPIMGGERAEEYFGFSPALRYGRDTATKQSRLGKSAEQMIDLLWWFGPQSRQELAKRMCTRPTDQRELLKILHGDGIIEVEGDSRTGLLRVSDDLEHLLEHRQQADGSTEASKRQKAKNQDHSERFRSRLLARNDSVDQTPTAS